MADGSLIFDTRLDDKGLKSGLERLGGVGKAAMLGIGTAIAGASTALLGFGTYAAKVGSGFSASMSEVAAISGASAKELELLSATALKMGSTTKFSASESAEALKYMAMAGWDTYKMIEGLPGVMNLAAASGESLALVSDILTDSMTAFGLEASQAVHFADLLAVASSKSNTNVALLGESFKYVAPLAGALGYSAEDVAVALGLMANAGVKGSQAGTALRSALTRLAKPTKEVSQGMELLGLGISDVQGLSLDETLSTFRESFKSLSETQKAQAAAMIFGKEAMSGMLAVINASDEDYLNLIENMYNAAGAAENMAKVMNDNLTGDIALMKSALEGLGISAFKGLDDPLRKVTQNITGYIDELSKSMLSVDDIRQQMLDAGASIEFVNNELSSMDTSNMIGGFEGLAIKLGEVIASLLTDIISQLPRFLELGIQIVQLTVNGINDSLPTIIPAAISMIGILISGIAQTLPLLIDSATQIVSNLANFITDNSSGMVTSAINLITIIGDSIISNLPILIGAAFSIITALVEGLMSNLPLLIETAPRLINDFANSIYAQVPVLLKAGIQIIITITKGIIDAIPTLISNLPQVILAIVNVFTLYNWASIGNNLILGIKDGAVAFKGNIVSAIKGIGNNIVDSIKYILNGGGIQLIGKNFLLGIKDGVLSITSSVLGVIRSVSTEILNGFRGVLNFRALQNIGVDMVKGLGQGILNTKDWIWGVVKGFSSDILNSFKSFLKIKSPSQVMRDEVGKPIAQGVAEGITRSEKDVIAVMNSLGMKLTQSREDYIERIQNFEAQALQQHHKRMSDLGISLFTQGAEREMAIQKQSKLDLEAALEEIDRNIEAQKDEKRNKKNQKIIDANIKRLEDEKAILEEEKKILEDYSRSYEQVFNKMVQEYESAYNTIVQKQETLANKLISFGNLIEVVRDKEGKVVKDAWGNDMVKLGDINAQLAKVEQYGSLLDQLQKRGADADAMSAMLTMGVEEAVRYGELLMKQSDADFDAYMKAMAAKRDAANRIAKQYYQKELDSLKNEFSDKVIQNLGDISRASHKIGQDSAQQIAQGLNQSKGLVIAEARAIVNEMQSIVNAGISQARANASAATSSIVQSSSNKPPAGNTYQITNKYDIKATEPEKVPNEINKSTERNLRAKGVTLY